VSADAAPTGTGGRATLDGREVEVAADETILSAATRAGLEVPALCRIPGHEPEGGCRLCLVELRRAGRTVAACHTALPPGEIVVTSSDRLTRLRRGILELMLAAPELDAARLAAGPGEFARLLERHGLARPSGVVRARAAAAAPSAVDDSHPYLRFDPALCILCRRCVHACEEVQGQFVYGLEGRGAETRLVYGSSARFADSDCVACGACVELCPTAALSDADRDAERRAGMERPAVTESVCGYCGTGCRVEVSSRDGAVVAIRGVPDAAVNRGHLCAKGRFAHGWRTSPERLLAPLLRDGDGFRPIGWDDAMSLAARRLLDVQSRRGSQAIGLLTSSRSTNEAAYLLQKLFRSRLRTNNVDCCARVCHSSTAAALRAAIGTGAASACFDDIERARLIVVAGANPTEAHPVLGARIKQAVIAGARLLVVDPRRTELAEWAELHLAPRPGTNVPLFNALAAMLLALGAVDRAAVSAAADGLPELEAFLAGVALDRAAAATGVPLGALRQAASLLATGPALYVHGLGLSELAEGVAAVTSLCNLALLTGAVGRPGAGLLPLRGQNNVQGNADMGAMPDLLTGYQSPSNPRVHERFTRAWGRPPPVEPGLTIPGMLEAARDGRLAALWICGEDIAQSDPFEERVLEALGALEFLVVQELFMTETARRAHLVLPAAGALEQEGSFTNAERRIQRVAAAVAPAGQARPDWRVAVELARALGEDWRYDGPADVLDEIADVAPQLFGGAFAARLSGDGLQWPCPTPGHPGTERLSSLGGRPRLRVVQPAPNPEHDVPGRPFLLITGRVLQQYNVGSMTRRTPQARLWDGDLLEVHPADAVRLGLADGALALVESRWGAVELRVRLADRVGPGTLFLSFHDPATHANRLVGPCEDPVSHCPQYKATAVSLRPAAAPPPAASRA
jgi:formate dehydrogenase alpha subunit